MIPPISLVLSSIILINLVVSTDGFIKTDRYIAVRKLGKIGLSHWTINVPSRIYCAVQCNRVHCAQFVWKSFVCHLNSDTCEADELCDIHDKPNVDFVFGGDEGSRTNESITQDHCYKLSMNGRCIALLDPNPSLYGTIHCLVFQFIRREDKSYVGHLFGSEQILCINETKKQLYFANVDSENPYTLRMTRVINSANKFDMYHLHASFEVNGNRLQNVLSVTKVECV